MGIADASVSMQDIYVMPLEPGIPLVDFAVLKDGNACWLNSHMLGNVVPLQNSVCTLCVHMSAGSSVCIVFPEVSLPPQLLQKLVFSFKCFSLFT